VKSKHRLLERPRAFAHTFGIRIRRNRVLSYIRKRLISAENSIRSVAIVWIPFTLLVTLVTLVAYPGMLLSATLEFLGGNPALLSFIEGTFDFSAAIANAAAPIGAVATSIQRALIAAAPNFRTAVEGVAAITSGLATLNPAEKFLLIQSSAVWAIAIVTLFAGQRLRARRRAP
jgi:hypothetical protein